MPHPALPDFRRLPDEALLPLDLLCQPVGPVPFRRSKFLEMVKLGEAPQPAFRAPRCTRWRLGDVLAWLDQLAGRGAA
jgi:predicted DNA-binding transcriptional regulator AlpA